MLFVVALIYGSIYRSYLIFNISAVESPGGEAQCGIGETAVGGRISIYDFTAAKCSLRVFVESIGLLQTNPIIHRRLSFPPIMT